MMFKIGRYIRSVIVDAITFHYMVGIYRKPLLRRSHKRSHFSKGFIFSSNISYL
jgi:hypothetical protein